VLTDDHEAQSGRPLPPLADEAANDLVVLGETLQMFDQCEHMVAAAADGVFQR
jgi:hypothetical protein